MRPGLLARAWPGHERTGALPVCVCLPVRAPVPHLPRPCSPTGSPLTRGLSEPSQETQSSPSWVLARRPLSVPSQTGRQRLRGWPEATLSPSHPAPSGGGRVPTAQATKMRSEGCEQLSGSWGDGEPRAAQGRGSWVGLGGKVASEPHPSQGPRPSLLTPSVSASLEAGQLLPCTPAPAGRGPRPVQSAAGA